MSKKQKCVQNDNKAHIGRAKRKKLFKLLGGIVLVALFTVIICAFSLIAYAKEYYNSVSAEGFKELARSQDRTTHLYYLLNSEGDGEVAVELTDQALYSAQNREWVTFKDIPQKLIDAFVAIEDHRFYEHKGVDLKRTLGAAIGFIGGRSSYGGSTITQQLIKNVTGNDEYSVSRKLHELIFALKLDKALSKEEILELYLNTIYLSDSCYGIGSAAEYYFGHGCSELTLEECAALACIPQSPAKWNPRTQPQNNSERRRVVLLRMSELGYITDEQMSEALERPLEITDKTDGKTQANAENRYSWYTEAVIDDTLELLIKNGYAVNRQTASKLLYSGGLSIITAQSPQMQKIAEDHFADERNFPAVDNSLIQPECSVVVIDPRNGNILALVGGRGEKKGDRVLNFATHSKRSPGSSIKPLSVYTPALDSGKITYGTVIDDTPYKFLSTSKGGLRPWPQNSPRGYRGLTTVRDAVRRSVNTVSVKILSKMDKKEIFYMLRDRLGLSGLVEAREIGGAFFTDIAESPLAHGQLTIGVTVREITGAYTAIANGGVYHKPKTVLKIFDSEGKLLVDNTDGYADNGGERVFSSGSAAVMTKLLQGVTSTGTASSIKLKTQIDCAGKTGTTTADKDRWFIGYTPDLLCGVWFGYEEPRSLTGFIGSPSVRVWDSLMTKLSDDAVLGHSAIKHFPQSDELVTVRYCKDSGKLSTAACLADPRGCRLEVGYFVKGTEPKTYCDCHTLVRYDVVNHGVAGEDCPSENCRNIGMIRVERSFPMDVKIADAQYVYRDIGSTPPCLVATEPFFLTILKKGSYPGSSSGTDYPFNHFCYHCYFDERSVDTDRDCDGENNSFEDMSG